MDVAVVKDEGLSKEYRLTVPAATIDAEMDAQLLEFSQSARLKGFRPGKVPVSYLRKTYGQRMLGDVITKTVDQSVKDCIEQQDLGQTMQPKVEIVEYDEGKDLVLKVEVQVLPTIPDIEFSKITIKRPVVDEKSIEEETKEALERIAQENTSYSETKRMAQKGDALTVDFKGMIDGEAFEGGSAEDYRLILGSGNFIPGFEDQLLKKKPGEDVEVNVTFPEDYQSENLAGKEAVFAVKIKKSEKPEAKGPSDELAQNLGLENLEKLTELVRQRVGDEYAGHSRMHAKKDLLDRLDEALDIELPALLVDQEAEQVARQMQAERGVVDADHDHDPEHDHDHDHNHDHDHDHDHEEKKVEVTDEDRELAQRRVKLGLALAEFGRRNNISVTDQELGQRIAAEARRYPGQEQAFMNYVKENPQMAEQFRGPMFEEKVVDFILAVAEVEDVKTSKEDLMKELVD
ncbi:MAG TPA: trigger factor [Alphaproteobacteria bacterium]|nr:trigger factor [Alphaproteobacteria bacterium]